MFENNIKHISFILQYNVIFSPNTTHIYAKRKRYHSQSQQKPHQTSMKHMNDSHWRLSESSLVIWKCPGDLKVYHFLPRVSFIAPSCYSYARCSRSIRIWGSIIHQAVILYIEVNGQFASEAVSYIERLSSIYSLTVNSHMRQGQPSIGYSLYRG